MRTALLHAGLLAVALTLAGQAAAADDDSPEQRLTGGSAREWVFQRIVRSMGSEHSCTSGLTYTFDAAEHSLVVRECKNSKLEVSYFTWRLANASAGDTALTIDRLGAFVLLFRDALDGSHFMRLRSEGNTPTQPTVDKEFRLNED